jgi:hypothetical protein
MREGVQLGRDRKEDLKEAKVWPADMEKNKT